MYRIRYYKHLDFFLFFFLFLFPPSSSRLLSPPSLPPSTRIQHYHPYLLENLTNFLPSRYNYIYLLTDL